MAARQLVELLPNVGHQRAGLVTLSGEGRRILALLESRHDPDPAVPEMGAHHRDGVLARRRVGGVFQTSYHVTNPRLPLEERRRHMETAYWIDILARLGNIPLLPIGLHMATCGATRDPLKGRLHQPRSARAVPRLTAIA